jgi:hypothetical protein
LRALCLTDGALATKHVGDDAARSKDRNRIALANAALIHQDSQRFHWFRMAQRIPRFLELAYQRSHQFSQILFLGREWTSASIQFRDLAKHALVFPLGCQKFLK